MAAGVGVLIRLELRNILTIVSLPKYTEGMLKIHGKHTRTR